MPAIGYVRLTEDGFKVQLCTVSIRTGERSGKHYLSLSLAAPEFGKRVLYANLGRVAGQEDLGVLASLWNPAN